MMANRRTSLRFESKYSVATNRKGEAIRKRVSIIIFMAIIFSPYLSTFDGYRTGYSGLHPCACEKTISHKLARI